MMSRARLWCGKTSLQVPAPQDISAAPATAFAREKGEQPLPPLLSAPTATQSDVEQHGTASGASRSPDRSQ